MNNKLRKIFAHVILCVMSFMTIFPIYWMIISSLKDSSEIFGYNLIVNHPTFANYLDAITTKPLFRMMLNSLIISVITVAFQMVIAILFAYAFVRWNFKGKNFIYMLITAIWLIPIQVIMVPNYIQVVKMGINNTLIAMILPNICSVFTMINMYQSFNQTPKSLIDAARMDGSSELQILFDIILPNMKSSVASLGIVLLINSWNDYLWPTLIARTDEVAPIQIGLKAFIAGDTNMWGAVMAGATISTIPILIIYLFMSGKIVSSFMKGGIK